VTALDKFFRSARAPAWAFFCLALAVRAAVVLTRFGDELGFADERMYLRLADVIGHGNWLGEGTQAAPGPVYFWGTLRALGVSLLGIRLIHALAGAAAVAVLFLVARRLAGPRPAALAGIVMSVYPYLLFLSGLLYPQAVFHLTFLLMIYGLLRWMRDGGRRWFVLGGVALGVSALFVVPILSASPLVALWVVLAGRGSFLSRARNAVVLGLITLATILPATARNYLVSHRVILLSSMGGSAFYWANNDQADPYNRDAEVWLEKYQRRQDREQARQGWMALDMQNLSTFRANRFWREQTPRAIRNYLIRLSMFFDVAPRSYTANRFTRDTTNELVAIATSLPVLLLAPIGVWRLRRRWRWWFPLVAIPLFQALTYAFFHVSVRYRIPFESCFILFAAVGACALVVPEWIEPIGARDEAPEAPRPAG
jgi:4-amino-4-deoxy-L-arabinose transferase-like glycosyltransferase